MNPRGAWAIKYADGHVSLIWPRCLLAAPCGMPVAGGRKLRRVASRHTCFAAALATARLRGFEVDEVRTSTRALAGERAAEGEEGR